MASLWQCTCRPVVFNARGTGNSPVATPQFYSASHTDDLRAAIRHLQATFPGVSCLQYGCGNSSVV